jgi:hypothetical protein
MIDKFHFWDDYSIPKKKEIMRKYVTNANNDEYILNYFENYLKTLEKNTLNSHIKSVNNR